LFIPVIQLTFSRKIGLTNKSIDYNSSPTVAAKRYGKTATHADSNRDFACIQCRLQDAGFVMNKYKGIQIRIDVQKIQASDYFFAKCSHPAYRNNSAPAKGL
jgi:hypothetical protein